MAVKADRKKLKKEYISGGVSYHDLAEKYNISDSTVKRWAKEDCWSAAKAEADTKAEQKMIDAAVQDKMGVAADTMEIAKRLLEKLAAALNVEPEVVDPARLKQYTGVLADLQAIRGDRSKLDLKEQKARIARLQQDTKRTKAQTETIKAGLEANRPENRAVIVELMGEAEDYGG